MPVIERYIDRLVGAPAPSGATRARSTSPTPAAVSSPRSAARGVPARICHSGPAGGVIGGAAGRPARRLRERDHVRHGRHQRRPRAGARRRPDARARVAGRLEHPDPLPGDRPGRDRRRGRHDRVGRHGRLAARRAAERRRRSGPGLLRQGQRGADDHRRPPLPRAASTPRPTSAATSRSDPSSPSRRSTRLAEQLGLSAPETASGILRIANANMTSATHLISVERGHDPRDFALVAGRRRRPAARGRDRPRACASRTSWCRRRPGVTSALGILQVDLRHDILRAGAPAGQARSSPAALADDVRRARRRGPEILEAEEIPEDRRIDRAVGRRALLRADPVHEPEARRRAREHRGDIEALVAEYRSAVRARVRLRAARGRGHGRDRQRPCGGDRAHGRRRAAEGLHGGATRRTPHRESARVYFDETGEFTETPIYDRAKLGERRRDRRARRSIEQTDTTVLVPPGRERTGRQLPEHRHRRGDQRASPGRAAAAGRRHEGSLKHGRPPPQPKEPGDRCCATTRSPSRSCATGSSRSATRRAR